MIIITYKDNTQESFNEQCMLGYHLTVSTIDDPGCTMIRIIFRNFTNKVIFKTNVKSVVYTFVPYDSHREGEELFKNENTFEYYNENEGE